MGRVREFDEDAVLDKALTVFREQGYEATSVQDLVSATGVNRASLYGVFGNKEKLFSRVMERYGTTRSVAKTTLGLPPGMPRIRAALAGTAAQEANDPRGCLMVNSIVERGAQDEGMRRQGKKTRTGLERFFAECLADAERLGQIRAGQDLTMTAKFLTNALFGLRVTAKTMAGKGHIRDLAAYTMKLIE